MCMTCVAGAAPYVAGALTFMKIQVHRHRTPTMQSTPAEAGPTEPGPTEATPHEQVPHEQVPA